MPILQINTNLSTTPSDFSIKTCELMADIFKSPIQVSYNNIQNTFLQLIMSILKL